MFFYVGFFSGTGLFVFCNMVGILVWERRVEGDIGLVGLVFLVDKLGDFGLEKFRDLFKVRGGRVGIRFIRCLLFFKILVFLILVLIFFLVLKIVFKGDS